MEKERERESRSAVRSVGTNTAVSGLDGEEGRMVGAPLSPSLLLLSHKSAQTLGKRLRKEGKEKGERGVTWRQTV